MTNERWELTRTLERLHDEAFMLDMSMTLCTFTPEQAAFLNGVIERLQAVAEKRQPVKADAA